MHTCAIDVFQLVQLRSGVLLHLANRLVLRKLVRAVHAPAKHWREN